MSIDFKDLRAITSPCWRARGLQMLLAGFLAVCGAPGIADAQAAPAVGSGGYRETVLHSFDGIDGQWPEAPLLYRDGVLYGTTYLGGDYSGALFDLDLGTKALNVLYSFLDNSQSSLVDVKGTLYGTTDGSDDAGDYGTVFSFDLATQSQAYVYFFCQHSQACVDGDAPRAGVINVHGTLYGTTAVGGGSGCAGGFGCGTLFSLDPATGSETVVHAFCNQVNCADGSEPLADLIYARGTLYGTTYAGGSTGCFGGQGCGTAFAVDPATGALQTLHAFCSEVGCADGSLPEAGLTEMKGLLYGTTSAGGNGCGTVFAIDPSTGAETVVYAFRCGADGDGPVGSLIAVKGLLYGATYGGGTGKLCNGGPCGTVFSVDPSSGVETVLYSFKGVKDGARPRAGLVEAGGTFYGTTFEGGLSNDGTVFSLAKTKSR